jgi:peptidoglycan/LPS O-acetylase OafA/YrhL
LIRFTPLRLLTGARFPVIVFFVLSGFVLARYMLGGNRFSYADFAVRRICRIYLPFAASIVCAWWLANALGTEPVAGAAAVINSDWVGSTSPEALIRHLAMLGRRDDTNLNGVVWSLVIEMRISLIFPLLILVAICSSWAALALGALSVAAYGAAIALGQPRLVYTGETVTLSVLTTVYFVLPFLAGILVAKHGSRAREVGSAAGAGCAAIILLGFLVVQRLGEPLIQDLGYTLLAATLILLAIRCPSMDTWLGHPMLQWSGRVSYSLYLFHVIILNALFRGLSGTVDLTILAIATVPLSLMAAAVAFRVIEQPSVRIGQVLTAEVMWGGSASDQTTTRRILRRV